jgi:hypothetical protein
MHANPEDDGRLLPEHSPSHSSAACLPRSRLCPILRLALTDGFLFPMGAPNGALWSAEAFFPFPAGSCERLTMAVAGLLCSCCAITSVGMAGAKLDGPMAGVRETYPRSVCICHVREDKMCPIAPNVADCLRGNRLRVLLA